MAINPNAPPYYQLALARDLRWQSRYDAILSMFDFASLNVWSVSDIMNKRKLFLDVNKDYTLSGEDSYWALIEIVKKAIQVYNFFFDTQYPAPEYEQSKAVVDPSYATNFFNSKEAWTPMEKQQLLEQQNMLAYNRAVAPSVGKFLNSILTLNELNEYTYWAQGQSRTSTSYTTRVGTWISQAGGVATVVLAGGALGYAVVTVAGATVGAYIGTPAAPAAATPGILASLPTVTLPTLGTIGATVSAAVIDQGKKEISNLINGNKQKPENIESPVTPTAPASSVAEKAGVGIGAIILVTVLILGFLLKPLFKR